MRAVSISNRGGRPNNEDRIRYTNSQNSWCFVLCDGLGGHQCGEVASALAADVICAEFEKNPSVSGAALQECIEKAALALETERLSDSEKYNMSSTVVALVSDGKQAVWAHAGDSRLYYISDGEILQITEDHSIAYWEFKNGLISYDYIRHSPNQNKLLRCISDTDRLDIEISPEIEVKKGDAFLLCSDGFWEFVTEQDIEDALSKSSSPKEWLEKMLVILHKNETEHNDNYSAVAVMV